VAPSCDSAHMVSCRIW